MGSLLRVVPLVVFIAFFELSSLTQLDSFCLEFEEELDKNIELDIQNWCSQKDTQIEGYAKIFEALQVQYKGDLLAADLMLEKLTPSDSTPLSIHKDYYALFWKSVSDKKLGRSVKAIEGFARIIDQFNISDSTIYYRSKLNVGNLFNSKGMSDLAEVNYYESLQFLADKDDRISAGIYMDLASTASRRGEYSLADSLYRKSENLLEKAGALRMMMKLFKNMSNLHHRAKNIGLRDEYLEKTKTLNKRLNDSLMHLNLEYNEKVIKQWSLEPRDGKIKKCIELFNLSLRKGYFKKQYLMCHAIGLLYKNDEKYPEAIEWFSRGFHLSYGAEVWGEAARFSALLSEIYDQTENFKLANLNRKRQIQFSDSTMSLMSEFSLRAMRIQEEVNAKDRKILEQENENLINAQELANERQLRWILIVSLVVVVIFVVSANRLRSVRKREAETKAKVLELEKEQELADLIDSHVFEKQQAANEASEKERDRMAKEIHDGIGSEIYGIKALVQGIDVQKTKKIEIIAIAQKLDIAYEGLRSLSHNMPLANVESNTFIELIQTFLSNFKSANDVAINLVVFPENQPFNLNKKDERSLLRVVQEAIINVKKHAKASKIEVTLTKGEDELSVVIEDDGKGFDPALVTNGAGLSNMMDRIEGLRGRLNLDSREMRGTIINITIPLK